MSTRLVDRRCVGLCLLLIAVVPASAVAQVADTPASRSAAAMEFHRKAIAPPGVLVPMYVYPANIHTNANYNTLMDLKREYESLPFWVILNPASGPGQQTDANYTKAIDRLQGAGCVTLGYVSTDYGKRPSSAVMQDLQRWRSLYPRMQGVFFDEMIYEDTETAVEHQQQLSEAAREQGYWPLVANPGAETPGRYFAAQVADVIVVHEAAMWPDAQRLRGDYFGGYADYPAFTRAVLLHSQQKVDVAPLNSLRRSARWFYVTERPYRANDPTAANPWDQLSGQLEELCRALADPSTGLRPTNQ